MFSIKYLRNTTTRITARFTEEHVRHVANGRLDSQLFCLSGLPVGAGEQLADGQVALGSRQGRRILEMRLNSKRQRLIALPVQVIEVPEGVVLKRSSTEVMIMGANAARSVRMVLDVTRANGATPKEIRSLFARSARTQVDALIKNLVDRRFLLPADNGMGSLAAQETNLEVFFWNFGEAGERVI